jgi:hypothetical protein
MRKIQVKAEYRDAATCPKSPEKIGLQQAGQVT